MSYILDALKKSEKKRKQGTVPDVLTAQETVYYEPKKRRLWAYLIIVALVLNSAALVWFVPWKSKKSDAVVQSNAETKTALKEQYALSGDMAKPAGPGAITAGESETNTPKFFRDKKSADNRNVLQQHQLSATKGSEQKKISEVQKPVIAAQVTRDTSPVAPPQAPVMPMPAEPKHVNGDAVPIPNKVYTLSELPLSIQQKLPSFGISVFLYSDDPTSRMVKINNQMMREGQYLSEGLKLEEINQNGIIFSYQNFRFRVGLK